MAANNLNHETGTAIHDWRSDLATIITTRLSNSYHAMRRRASGKDYENFRRAIGVLLTHLTPAIENGRPESFAEFVSNGDALSTALGLSTADFRIVLEQVRRTLKQHLPGQQGVMASEYIGFALAKQMIGSHNAQLQNIAA